VSPERQKDAAKAGRGSSNDLNPRRAQKQQAIEGRNAESTRAINEHSPCVAGEALKIKAKYRRIGCAQRTFGEPLSVQRATLRYTKNPLQPLKD
jgi:hypothetical protein